MFSIPELPVPVGIVLRALLYALAIATLVLFLPSGDHTFIYQGF